MRILPWQQGCHRLHVAATVKRPKQYTLVVRGEQDRAIRSPRRATTIVDVTEVLCRSATE